MYVLIVNLTALVITSNFVKWQLWGGEGEMYRERNMETYITICKIDSQWEFAVWFRKFKQGLCINLEGWDGQKMGGRFIREGLYLYIWLIHVEV